MSQRLEEYAKPKDDNINISGGAKSGESLKIFID